MVFNMNILIPLLGCLVLALSSASDPKLKYCAYTQTMLNECKSHASKTPELLECVFHPTATECMKTVKNGDADLMTADGENIYHGGLINYNLRPIYLKKKPEECCYGVAVAKKGTGFTINDLRGKKSCHSCYKSPSGWNIPIGRLVSDGKISWDGPDDKALEKAVSEFFGASCAPGISKSQYGNMCQSCKGDCSCSSSESQHGDEGALRCLKDGGDVAFVCHKAIPDGAKQDYELLCMDGTRKAVDEFKNCYLGKEPSFAVIGRKDTDVEKINKIFDHIKKDWRVEKEQLPDNTDSFLYLGDQYFEIMRALKDGPRAVAPSPRKVEWCTTSHAEQQKCDGLQIDRLECRRAASVDECIKKIKRGEADALAVDGGQVYNAGKCGLVPAMVEQYDATKCGTESGASSYFVVAVVRKDSGISWSNLEGKKSCHTGLNRNAGWKIPRAVLCIENNKCDIYKFFSEGCAPGADLESNMCKLCKGSGKAVGDEGKCKASAQEMYYGYDGAFRCLAEGTGGVAFIKHSIVNDYTDGKPGLPDWAKDLQSKDFQLICPKAPFTAEVTDFEKCNLASVPAHAVVTRLDVRNDVVSVLKDAQANGKELFKSTGGRNLLFSDSTKCLQEVKQSYKEFLTETYIKIIEKNHELDPESKPDLVKACTLENCKI